jgi:hypothetical protein
MGALHTREHLRKSITNWETALPLAVQLWPFYQAVYFCRFTHTNMYLIIIILKILIIEYWVLTWGRGQPPVGTKTQITTGFTVTPVFTRGLYKNPVLSVRVRICLIEALLTFAGSTTPDRRFSFYDQPELGTHKVYDRRVSPPVKFCCIWRYPRGQ